MRIYFKKGLITVVKIAHQNQDVTMEELEQNWMINTRPLTWDLPYVISP
jgi:hypothetical protein